MGDSAEVVLLTKLSTMDDRSYELFDYYVIATSQTFENEVEEFNTCIKCLQKLSDNQYDFAWLTENAKQLDASRRDFRNLCDNVCVLLGNRIEELCKHTRAPIVTAPANFDGACPFGSEQLVAYGNVDTTVRVDGVLCKVVDTKIESTPYYNIKCSMIDM